MADMLEGNSNISVLDLSNNQIGFTDTYISKNVNMNNSYKASLKAGQATSTSTSNNNAVEAQDAGLLKFANVVEKSRGLHSLDIRGNGLALNDELDAVEHAIYLNQSITELNGCYFERLEEMHANLAAIINETYIAPPPEPPEPPMPTIDWHCAVCRRTNAPEELECTVCTTARPEDYYEKLAASKAREKEKEMLEAEKDAAEEEASTKTKQKKSRLGWLKRKKNS